MRTRVFLSLLVVSFFLVFGVATGGFAVQNYALGTGNAPAAQTQPTPQPQPAATEPAAPQQGQEHPAASAAPPKTPQPTQQEAQAEAHRTGQSAAATPAAKPEAGHGDGGHGVQLPELSPIPGVTFVDVVISLMEKELHGRFLGWRSNDLVIGQFTDNINNYQLGVLEAIRFTTLRLKDSLTRLGDADTYDPDLEQAVNLFMNSATLWWFPSAENSYSQAVEHLKKFKAKLEKGQRNFYYRRDNLVSLLAAYKDFLGNVNRTLVMPVGFFEADDHFYYAKGVAHVYYEILKVVRVGFKNQLATMHATDITDQILHELHTAEGIDPWIILNSDFGGFFANHRANLNAPLSEVAHLLVVMSAL
ncbi:MAG: DUF2333 family protein [Desulfobacteraceae bacterium]|nr:DUF2333 family protein [Desulfobacteraceae bacterium]